MNSIHYAAVISFPAVFCALYAAHQVGDHWMQTHEQACGKGDPSPQGRFACFMHVLSLTVTKMGALLGLQFVTGLPFNNWTLMAGLLLDAATHYWADRSAYHKDRQVTVTLQRLANRLHKGDFYELGERAIAPTGTGAYALDQSWHVGWLFITSLIIAAGA
ncbi:transcriptional regulator [Nonomuraea sp. CA-143628]|uniref:transcriptional regulator n=1 Tax=Nonomuraea sp. CA-143628 TaxID=3239997 RepID=UPI003D8F752C